jgi:hypothetical protein
MKAGRAVRRVAAVLLAALLLPAGPGRGDEPRICPDCGHEVAAAAAACGHCGAHLPPAAPETPATSVADVPPAPVPAPSAFPAGEAFEAASADVLLARQEQNIRPEVALALFENALALLAVADPAAIPPGAGEAILDGLKSCRAALAVGGATVCTECNGSGRRPGRAAGTQESAAVPEIPCPVCGGSGRVRAGRGADAARLAILRGRREAGLALQAAGRVPLGRAWVPAGWPAALNARQTAAVRRSLAGSCEECAGLGLANCRKCAGSGFLPCPDRRCRDGRVEEKSEQSLSRGTPLSVRVRCPVCKGTTRVPCETCRGQGAVACSACKGTGAAPLCRSCGGEGVIPCRRCAGRTTPPDAPPCQDCRGEGVVLCRACHGDGRRAR